MAHPEQVGTHQTKMRTIIIRLPKGLCLFQSSENTVLKKGAQHIPEISKSVPGLLLYNETVPELTLKHIKTAMIADPAKGFSESYTPQSRPCYHYRGP